MGADRRGLELEEMAGVPQLGSARALSEGDTRGGGLRKLQVPFPSPVGPPGTSSDVSCLWLNGCVSLPPAPSLPPAFPRCSCTLRGTWLLLFLRLLPPQLLSPSPKHPAKPNVTGKPRVAAHKRQCWEYLRASGPAGVLRRTVVPRGLPWTGEQGSLLKAATNPPHF